MSLNHMSEGYWNKPLKRICGECLQIDTASNEYPVSPHWWRMTAPASIIFLRYSSRFIIGELVFEQHIAIVIVDSLA